MDIKFTQKLSQKLIISQKMRQSLSILSLSYEELKQAIQNELIENPLLEAIEAKPLVSYQNQVPAFNVSRPDSFASFYDKKHRGSQTLIEDFLTEPLSLKSFVLKQAEMSFFSKEIKIVLPLLISFLDERAYLNIDIKALALKENIPLSLLKESLSALQSLEPIGLGGRNLEECLLIQLRHKKEDTRIPELIIKNHLNNLKEKKYKNIACDLNISTEELTGHLKVILSLEPNPGRNFSQQPTVFIRPDLYITKENGIYHVLLNQEDLPNLRLSLQYKESVVKSWRIRQEERKYFQERIDSARWFIQSIQQRQEKVKQITYRLIEYQKDFLEKGFDYLRPLRMKDLADEMSVHISTISRTVNKKYAYTHRGLLPLKIFFQKGVRACKGSLISTYAIKRSIKKWIEGENPEKPLSDEQIRIKITERFHTQLLRRSICEYRSSLGIPSSRERKRIFLNSLRASFTGGLL